jgi:hypothetical protein
MISIDMSNWSDKDKELYRRSKLDFKQILAMKPRMSDKEFMEKTEVSDEQYSLGLVLPTSHSFEHSDRQ